MTKNWIFSVNQAVGPESITDLSGYVQNIDSLVESPVDLFYRTMREMLLSAKQDLLDSHKILGPLLLVGMVSTTENYFRDMLGKIIQICPISKAIASEQTVSLGSVVWHGGVDLERGIFEHLSFAGADNIKSICKKFTGLEFKKGGLSFSILDEFSKVCELRHGIVHSNSILAGKNAIRLGLNRTGNRFIKVNIGYREIQECASVLTTLVASVNTEFFEELCRRWAIEWRKQTPIDSTNEMLLFEKIWNSFYSHIDATEGNISNSLTMEQCAEEVKKEYKLI